jgi:signal transduction histidine kinase
MAKPQKKLSFTLGWRLVPPVGLVILMTVSLHILLISSPKEIYARKMRDGQRIGRLVEAMVLCDMRRANLHEFQTYLSLLPFGDDMESIQIYDRDAVLRYAVGESITGLPVNRLTDPHCSGCHESAAVAPEKLVNMRRNAAGETIFQADFPLLNGEECQECHSASHAYLGNLITELKFSPVEARYLSRRKSMIYVGMFVMSAALIISWFILHYQVVKPVKSLVRVIEKSKRGDLAARIETSRSDEIGYLVRSFNEMMDTLVGFQTNLEAQVQTRTKELESSRVQLLLRENLASLGRLAAGIAHELGNPLTGISSIVQLVKRRKQDDPFVVEQLNLVREEIDRLARLSRQMVDLARPDNVETSVFELFPCLERAHQIAHLDRRLKKRGVKMPATDGPLLVAANEDAVIQIVMNLLFNAADATGDDGVIEVSISTDDEKTAEVRVRDNGTGIPEEVQNHIFDPFFTDKETGSGTGLGLSVSHSLAHSFHGDLILESSDEGGSVFLLKVPLKQKRES